MPDMNTFDAIVVGSGISGGWAAKELCEKGLKTLVLERGRQVEHVRDYPTATMNPWDFRHPGTLSSEMKEKQHIQVRGFCNESNSHFFVNDLEHPYNQVKPFDWIRGYHVGGRSLMWGRQCYRWSDLDFEANARDGIAIDWPIRYRDIAPWYSYVEKFAGISGSRESLPQLPDGEFLPPMEMNCLEKDIAQKISSRFTDRRMIIGRVANLTRGLKDRGPCQFRNACDRGCPFSGYFSSNSVTLPAARATGNLTLRPDAIVMEVLYDKDRKKATGIRIIDANTKKTEEFFAKIIFLNASTIGSTFILMNSRSDAFPNGMGNGSDQLGRNLMDHHYRVGASGQSEDFRDQYFFGRRANGIYVPRFRNINEQTRRTDYIRGFGFQGGASRGRPGSAEGIGAELKDALQEPGGWSMWLGAWGEHLPYADNRMTLSKDRKDAWGLPLVDIDCEFRENEKIMRKDMMNSAAETLEAAGLKNVQAFDNADAYPGLCIHEMGTARMGNDPKTSVLNRWNQLHEVKNVFVTDGACMTSSANQNPSVTYMALTARAADYAVRELKKGSL
ncbi:MAG: GMC family oxidoreductase [Chitinophagaceae bacterium]|jgi:choline dehydrogenase-like flavoprotein|nr:GMC family oxidoreductase [Chitinophagaceae bacterium]